MAIQNQESVKLFLDEVNIHHQTEKTGDVIIVPTSTKLIAVKADASGILLKTSNGFHSGQPGRWLCSKKFYDNWKSLSFSTAGLPEWQPPELLFNKPVDAELIPAKWMKVEDAEEGDDVYCRGDYGREL